MRLLRRDFLKGFSTVDVGKTSAELGSYFLMVGDFSLFFLFFEIHVCQRLRWVLSDIGSISAQMFPRERQSQLVYVCVCDGVVESI